MLIKFVRAFKNSRNYFKRFHDTFKAPRKVFFKVNYKFIKKKISKKKKKENY